MVEIVEWKCPECHKINDGTLYQCPCGYIFGDQAIKENISRLSNNELMKIVNIDFADYRKETIDIAREELEKRKKEEAQKIALEKKKEEERRELQRKKEEERKELEEYEKLKAQKIQNIKDKKQNPLDNFVIEYTSYNQYKDIKRGEEAKKEIVQEHINNKALGSEHFNRAYEKTSPKSKIIILTTGCFLLLIISICSYFIFKNVSPEEIFEKNKKAVVFITTYDLLGKPLGYGSGFILAEDGVIATNLHVIEDAASMEVETYDEAILKPEGVLYIDQDNDMALVKLKTKEEAKLYKVKIGDPSKLEVGEKIYTISNPEGLKALKATFSDGIVSGIREGDGKKLIQITAPISHGSSGGAVLNKKGKVVAVSSLSLTDGQNLNFAYPIDLIKDVVKSRDIMYTFPNINASWQFVERNQFHSSSIVTTSSIVDFYYDPDSIVPISGNRKGFWTKATCKSTMHNSFYGFYRQGQSSFFCFEEIDCNSNKARAKVKFEIDVQNNTKLLISDFSKNQAWEKYSNGSPMWKMANAICSSQ